MPTSSAQGAAQVRTLTQQYTNARWLGTLGHVNGLNWDFAYPGGCNAASLTLGRPPQYRTDAWDPGRILEIWRGASRVWEGMVDEGVPDTSGWSITAHGSGTYGSTVMAHYTTWNLDNPLDLAIARGLRWKKPAFGSIGFMQSQPDDASITITDFLNNATIQAGLLWNVDHKAGNRLSIAAPPSLLTPNRLLVCTVPNPRTLAAGLNTLWYKYVNTVDSSNQQTYLTTDAVNAASLAKYGPLEQQVDFTNAGLMTSPAASGNALNILNQYVRANFASTFDVRHGQYLTMGGSPIDLGCETAFSRVVRLLLTDGSYGGEVVATPVTFVVGKYAYNDDTQTAQVTPYQSYQSDLSTLLTAVVPSLRQ